MKEKRQAEIVRIVSEQAVETQEQLLSILEKRGFKTTQATISRDIKELRLVKETAGGGAYRYAHGSGRAVPQNKSGRLRNIFREGVVSFDHAQNIVVIRTMPGLAGAAGAAIDGMEVAGLVGTLAGDDTVAMFMRTGQDAEAFLEDIRTMLN